MITIRNYTTLKQRYSGKHGNGRLITIRNYTTLKQRIKRNFHAERFDHHKELHYSQTAAEGVARKLWFDHHKELHYSQTNITTCRAPRKFDHHKELHYSQTVLTHRGRLSRLITIRNYTTLKQPPKALPESYGLITIRNYTTLKRARLIPRRATGLITIRNYTTLKLLLAFSRCAARFDHHKELHYSQTL